MKGGYTMKLAYPACFYYEDEGYSVEFPDLKGCITQGDTLEDALEMAEAAALGWLLDELEDGAEVPSATKIEKVKLEREGFVSLILLDLGTYSEKYCKNKYVKKTLTVPFWLNELSEKKEINFSKVLQDGLLEKARNK